MTVVHETHIRLDERGVAWIDDTNIKVIEVALDRIAHGFGPEEIQKAHSGYLSLAQIHAALAWYYDHQDLIEREIDRQLREVDDLRDKAVDSPLQVKLRELKAKS